MRLNSILFGFAFLSLLTVSTGLRVITISFQLRLSALISTDLALKTFSTFLHKPYLWHISNNSSKLIGNLTRHKPCIRHYQVVVSVFH